MRASDALCSRDGTVCTDPWSNVVLRDVSLTPRPESPHARARKLEVSAPRVPLLEVNSPRVLLLEVQTKLGLEVKPPPSKREVNLNSR